MVNIVAVLFYTFCPLPHVVTEAKNDDSDLTGHLLGKPCVTADLAVQVWYNALLPSDWVGVFRSWGWH